ncbi:long-chain fatty acid--CoA ligase [Prolixibacter sp. SD074]|uniref:AMP-dependent synthetase/ligase n=1 Tax=Prolixibacter sp. SD074 TaxID=2652391 RepID=UPI0012882EA1|nr:long-chain fatty acid--CoA ligase [Prolixibacter sp. SD074]GET29739.1 AMP-dependent synthetase [Prolixibacter sp. SD074]
MQNLTRLFDILDLYRGEYSQKELAFARKENGNWMPWSAADYVRQSDAIACALIDLGLEKGDKVATISGNRPEWNVLDMGAAQAGIIHVPVYPTLSLDEQKYILRHAGAKYLFVGDRSIQSKLGELRSGAPSLEGIYSFNEIDDARPWKELLTKGEELLPAMKEKIEEIKNSIHEDDLLTLIYTSGTTGTPKGVMLSHKNLLSNSMATAYKLGHGPRAMGMSHVALSFLPLCHVYERMMDYNFQINGLSVYYAESLATIARDIKEIRPHVFNTVPRLLEKVHEQVMEVGKDLTGVKKWIFDEAVKFTRKFYVGIKFNAVDQLKFKFFDKVIYSKWREALGGRINYMVSGGSALQINLHQFFWMAGMRVYEGYGLTETSPVIFVNDPMDDSRVKLGTVGPALDNGTETKLAEDGEILAKGPGLMLGYYKEEEMTREVIDQDGWFHTGDIGVLEDGQFLRITDRKKEIFKLKSGKYVAPQAVENILKGSHFIEQVFVVGENQKFASAIIVPAFDVLEKYAASKNLELKGRQEMIQHPEIDALLRKEVRQANKKLGNNEQVKRFKLVADTWSQGTGELSQTLKLKRKVLHQKYDALIREIFSIED